MPGPPPQPNARKPSAGRKGRISNEIVILPAEGRQGAPPEVPVGYAFTREGFLIWAELWVMPQAVAWERFGSHRAVARYVDLHSAQLDEKGDRLGRDNAELRQLETQLGLTPLAMQKLRWTVATDELTVARANVGATNLKDRIKVVG